MEYISDFNVEQFWKERYNLTPRDVLKKTGSKWRREVLNETFLHFSDSGFRANGKFRTDYTIPSSGEIKSKEHPGITGFTSLTSMKKLVSALSKTQVVRDNLIKETVKNNKLNLLKEIRSQEKPRVVAIER